jgi:hypothetical protein
MIEPPQTPTITTTPAVSIISFTSKATSVYIPPSITVITVGPNTVLPTSIPVITLPPSVTIIR